MENNQNNKGLLNIDVTEMLQAAMRRIERLEENQMQHEQPNPSDIMIPPVNQPGSSQPPQNNSRNSYQPPMRHRNSSILPSMLSSGTNRSAAVNQDFRRSFPSLGGGGSRNAVAPKKARRQSCIMVTPKETYTHDFCLLAEKNATKTPSLAELSRLREAGLGKKRITFDSKKSGHGKVRQVLETIYPKLKCQNGAFEILRGERGGVSVKLVLIPLSPDGYTVPYLKEQVGANTVLYIRPMQGDLSLSKVTEKVDVSIKTTCRNCSSQVSLADMKNHLLQCTQSASNTYSEFFDDSSDDDCFAESAAEYNRLKTSSNSSTSAFTSTFRARPSTSATSTSITTSRENDWLQELRSLFPMHKEQQLQSAITGANSLEEAADAILASDYVTKETNEKLVTQSTCTTPKNVDLRTLLEEFQISNATQVSEEFKVDRGAIWSDILKFYKKKALQPAVLCNRLEVTFKDEEGLDGGAVMVEFFNLAWEQVIKRLFEGNVESLVPVRDSSKLFLFRLTGLMIVHTILQNGPITRIPKLSPAIVSCMLGEDVEEIHNKLSKHDIPMNSATENIHTLIEELDKAKSEDAIQCIFSTDQKCEAYWQIVNACHWPIQETINSRNKATLIQEIIYNEIIRSRKDLIQEVKEGLETLGFFRALASHPHRFKELFTCRNECFGSEKLQGLLEYDPAKGFAEEQARDWLSTLVADSDAPLENDDLSHNIAQAILSFATGWEALPMCGSTPKVRVKYLPDDDDHELPTASACLKVLRIPTVHSSQGKFRDAILTALKFGRQGFLNP